MSSPLDGSRLRRSDAGSNGSFMFLVPMLARNRCIFECGGPRVYSYEGLLRVVASAAGIKPILFPVPFAAWGALARISELLPSPPITRNQVELTQINCF
jgi:hypothetical protein